MFVAKYFHHRIANCGLQAALYSGSVARSAKESDFSSAPCAPLPPPSSAWRARGEHQQSAN